MKRKKIEAFADQIEGTRIFSRKELRDYYRTHEKGFKDSAFDMRISYLKSSGFIRQVGVGKYTMDQRPIVHPPINRSLSRIANVIGALSVENSCIWSTEWLNEFSTHQFHNKLLLIEVDSDMTESVFYQLMDAGISNVYHLPNLDMLNKYILESNEAVIIKPIISRSPVDKKRKVIVPRLEKILVDVFVEDPELINYSGSEIYSIFRIAVKKYSINFSQILNYAGRRGKRELIRNYLINEINVDQRLL